MSPEEQLLVAERELGDLRAAVERVRALCEKPWAVKAANGQGVTFRAVKEADLRAALDELGSDSTRPDEGARR